MKKKFFALLMVMALVLGMSSTALADINSPTVDNTPTINSPTGDNTPSDSIPSEITVEWSKTNPWTVVAENVNTSDDYMEYSFRLWKDGELVDGYSVLAFKGVDVSISFSAAVGAYGEGEYYVTAFVYGDTGIVSEGISAKCTYTKPAKQLAAPANFAIDLENDRLVFDQVDGAYAYQILISHSLAGNENDLSTYDLIYDDNTSDGKVECDLQGFAEYVEHLKVDAADVDMKYTFGVCAVSEDIDKVACSEIVTCIGYENKLTTEQAKEKFDEAFENMEEEPEEAINALGQVSNDTIIEMLETDAAFAEKVEALDNVLIEELGDSYKGATSKTEAVDASKVKVVGAAINAPYAQSVELSFSEPEEEVTVPEKYENGVQLDISLLVDDDAVENLSVPVTITMPIPTGVAKENLVILHYHGDATEPVVIVPTVNEDGTMTFIVDGFSTFVVANQVVEGTVTPEAPKTGDASTTAVVWSLLFLAAGVVLVSKRNSFAK